MSHYVLLPGIIQLSKLNLLFGMDYLGKSRLLHLLGSLTSPNLLMGNLFPADLSCAITWFDPALRKAVVGVEGESLEYQVDGRRVPLPPRPYRVLTFGPDSPAANHLRSGAALTVSGVARFLEIDPWAARTVLTSMSELLPDVIADLSVEGENVRFSYQQDHRKPGVPQWDFWFYSLVAFAELQARAEPTILVLDEPLVHVHPRGQRKMLELFESSAWSFQTILTEHSLVAYERRMHGWSASVLIPEPDNRSRISQDDADLERIAAG
ncbi:hypothetical protein ACFXD5_15650 [Streptomyces sp. NPDC059385]|uniref:hypothetical protein n=1 Tax=Streptomyces sp. NPDC059385 TaxID=3346817 RepID=UPI00367F8B95